MLEHLETRPEFISKEYRLSITPKPGCTNKKKKWYITIRCEKCDEVTTKVYQKNTWHFMCNPCTKGKKVIVDFIEEANKAHNYRYTYENTVYINNKTPVAITCEVHGDFFQRPVDHLSGTGCPVCVARERTQAVPDHLKKENCTIYWGYFPSLNMWKIGITIQDVNKRFARAGEVLEKIWTKTLSYEDAIRLEKLIKEKTRHLRYNGKEKLLKNGGDYELFHENTFPTLEAMESFINE